ncbi:beta carbonic anhydrase 5, chloroplastic-like isoform X2 [Argentina anserina]|uniref:beta carbonic anhydrase 5, chloroplastic-like isoform X2 n=1 Tax=Argentina anserina TaxID=57926 RepID=UPI0021762A86|nr:beta carbonic anhydrase 5, chloroplastic-like isoform X2 [Potentilla anserina]
MAVLAPSSSSYHIQSISSAIFGSKLQSGEIQQTRLRLFTNSKRSLQLRLQATCNLWIDPKSSYPGLTIKASAESLGLTQKMKSNKLERVVETEDGSELFEDMKHRFLSFKKNKYLENLEHYQNLAKGQSPKFLVIGCADSRVCPSTILGFQPGEAFMVRNIANLVPPFESGPSETNAALEFSVNTLEVKNILVVGHSCCGGIRALMSMNDEVDKSFIQSWVVNGKDARSWTKAAASKLSFDQQCKHCEKESVNRSLLNLLTYPWIEEKVKKGIVSVHGGYYDFVDCTFEKWTLDYKEDNLKEKHGRISVKNQLRWS